jgi:hypothetical protein
MENSQKMKNITYEYAERLKNEGIHVTKLVCTKHARDLENQLQLERRLQMNVRGIRLKAIDSSAKAALINSEHYNNLESEVRLCIGAPVMVISNMSSDLGVVNGTTIGEVFDVVVDKKGLPVVVMVKLPKFSATNDKGFRGPSCVPMDGDFVVVPIKRVQIQCDI